MSWIQRHTPEELAAALDLGLRRWNEDADRELTIVGIAARLHVSPSALSERLHRAFAAGETKRQPRKVVTDRNRAARRRASA